MQSHKNISEGEWWRPSVLPPDGYRSKTNEPDNNTSFYPFSTELGYRVFKRLVEMKRTNVLGLQDHRQEDDCHIEIVQQMDHEGNNFYVKGSCSQNPMPIENCAAENLLKCSQHDDKFTSSNCQLNSVSKELMSEFQLNLKCDIDLDDL
ncbi:unnamed protein product [Heterobilharzia americana]|nr:unnamed protein product [Heterobilharzia americana]